MWKTKLICVLCTLVLLACLSGVQAQFSGISQSASNVANAGIGSNVNQQISQSASQQMGMTHFGHDWLSPGYTYTYGYPNYYYNWLYPRYYYPYYDYYYPYTYSYWYPYTYYSYNWYPYSYYW